MYHERLAEVEKEATAISTGKHPNYSLAMSEIDRRRKKQMEQVSEWRRHKNIDIHRQVQSSLRSAHATFLVRQSKKIIPGKAVGWIAEGEFLKRTVPLTLIEPFAGQTCGSSKIRNGRYYESEAEADG